MTAQTPNRRADRQDSVIRRRVVVARDRSVRPHLKGAWRRFAPTRTGRRQAVHRRGCQCRSGVAHEAPRRTTAPGKFRARRSQPRTVCRLAPAAQRRKPVTGPTAVRQRCSDDRRQPVANCNAVGHGNNPRRGPRLLATVQSPGPFNVPGAGRACARPARRAVGCRRDRRCHSPRCAHQSKSQAKTPSASHICRTAACRMSVARVPSP